MYAPRVVGLLTVLVAVSCLVFTGCEQPQSAPVVSDDGSPSMTIDETAPADAEAETATEEVATTEVAEGMEGNEPAAEETPAADQPSLEPMAAGEQAPAAEAPAAEAPAAEAPAAEPAPAATESAAADAPAAEEFVKAPLGLPPVPIPADNPMTAEKIELGKLLYFDKRVSKDGTLSCATCHDPQMAWTEHKPTSEGIGHQFGTRNSPTVINAAYAPVQFWDGRAESLEAQAVGPVGNPIEMGHSMDAVVEQFDKIAGYRERFEKVFGTGVTEEGFAKAVAAFERTVLSGNSPYDRFMAGDESAMTDAQKEGMELFEETGCSTCHAPPLFSNFRYYNAGVGIDKEKPDEGRKDVTGRDSDLGKFRVPPLREIANTHPYFHDGSVATLEEAVALMASGGNDNPNLAAQLKAMREAELTKEDQAKIVEFLKALSGEYPIIEPPAEFPQ